MGRSSSWRQSFTWPRWGPEELETHSHTVTQNSALSLSVGQFGQQAVLYGMDTIHMIRLCVLNSDIARACVRDREGEENEGERERVYYQYPCACMFAISIGVNEPPRCYAEQAVSSQNPWPISCEIDLCQKQSVSPHTVHSTHSPDSRCLFSAENKINCWRMKSIISR